MLEFTCCVTGHRNIPPEQLELVRHLLSEKVSQAIGDGFTLFISGYAEGVDQLFAESVIAEMEKNPNVKLEAAIPYRSRLSQLLYNPRTKSLLMAAKKVTISCEEYSLSSFHIRNHYMVEKASRVIAVHDGRPGGGTAATLRYAKAKGREIVEILILPNK